MIIFKMISSMCMFFTSYKFKITVFSLMIYIDRMFSIHNVISSDDVIIIYAY